LGNLLASYEGTVKPKGPTLLFSGILFKDIEKKIKDYKIFKIYNGQIKIGNRILTRDRIKMEYILIQFCVKREKR